jgi:hypothetical protein
MIVWFKLAKGNGVLRFLFSMEQHKLCLDVHEGNWFSVPFKLEQGESQYSGYMADKWLPNQLNKQKLQLISSATISFKSNCRIYYYHQSYNCTSLREEIQWQYDFFKAYISNDVSANHVWRFQNKQLRFQFKYNYPRGITKWTSGIE